MLNRNKSIYIWLLVSCSLSLNWWNHGLEINVVLSPATLQPSITSHSVFRPPHQATHTTSDTITTQLPAYSQYLNNLIRNDLWSQYKLEGIIKRRFMLMDKHPHTSAPAHMCAHSHTHALTHACTITHILHTHNHTGKHSHTHNEHTLK
jgi:hypothetical protein